jgi:hypothetical protein
MGARIPPKPAESDRYKSSGLLKLLDELYVGGMPGAAPAQPPVDGLKMPSKKLLEEPLVDEEDDEAITAPGNIIGSY